MLSELRRAVMVVSRGKVHELHSYGGDAVRLIVEGDRELPVGKLFTREGHLFRVIYTNFDDRPRQELVVHCEHLQSILDRLRQYLEAAGMTEVEVDYRFREADRQLDDHEIHVHFAYGYTATDTPIYDLVTGKVALYGYCPVSPDQIMRAVTTCHSTRFDMMDCGIIRSMPETDMVFKLVVDPSIVGA